MNKGFTIVELLAAIAIMAVIIIISVPAYEGISRTIKQQNLNSKLSMMEKSTLSYVNKYHKDKVFDGSETPVCYSITYLINNNVFSADNKENNGISDPVKGGNLTGYLKVTYNLEVFEIEVKHQYDNTGCTETIEPE